MSFELRTYRSMPGRMTDLLTRFREHTDGLFARYGMHSIGYWVSASDTDVLIYVLRHDGDPAENWAAFQGDAEWRAVKESSIEKGEIVAHIDSVFMSPTDFSALE